MIARAAAAPGDAVVEIGCGTARNLIRIARLYPETALFGLDASRRCCARPPGILSPRGLTSRIQLAQGYAEALTPALFGRQSPSIDVLFPYSLSMIPDWRQALMAAGEALAEDGRLHAVDFGDLTGMGPIAGGLLRRWLRLFHVEPRVEILQTLERQPNRLGDNSSQLVLLPARYAFLWTGNKRQMKLFADRHVAPQTQAAGNPRPGVRRFRLVDIR